jgi:hypothetical protein
LARPELNRRSLAVSSLNPVSNNNSTFDVPQFCDQRRCSPKRRFQANAVYEKKKLVKRLSESATRPAARPFFL